MALAREKYKLRKLAVLILPENTASIRLAERCGFAVERTLNEFKDWKNVALYSRRV